MNSLIFRDDPNCHKKERYGTIGEAAIALKNIYLQHGVVHDFYGCKNCGGYHTTSQIKSWKREKIEQLIIKSIERD